MRTACRWPTLAAVISCLLTAPGFAEDPPIADALKPHAMSLELRDGRLTGDGARWLVARSREVDFFMIGEQHATADLAEVCAALGRDLRPQGYSYLAIEVGRAGTRTLESLLRSPDPDAYADFLAADTNLLSIPFYFFREEVPLLREALAGSDQPAPQLWGLDQEFAGGGGIVLAELAEMAVTEAEKAAVAAALAKVAENPMFVATAPKEDLDALAAAFAGSSEAAKTLIEEVIVSNRIYAPFVGRGGNGYLANLEREQLMKAQFLRYFEAASERLGQAPKVLMKFGANHLFRGHSPTHVLSLGNFVAEYATAHGLEAFNLHVDCLGGELRDAQGGGAKPCNSYFLGGDSALRSVVAEDGLTLIDLVALRPQHELLGRLDDKSKQLVWAFDAYLAVPVVRPATFFEGTFPNFGQ